MIEDLPWQAVAGSISSAIGRAFRIQHVDAVGGGCINRSFCVHGTHGTFFVKLNYASRFAMFQAEAECLAQILETNSVRVPRPLCFDGDEKCAWLVLEYIDLAPGGLDDASAVRLGERLAALHRCTSAQFGWTRDNTIGSTPQINTQTSDWIAFWREQRLGFQLQLAADRGHTGKLQDEGARLLERLPELFSQYRPVPSLLHGDLWGGNAAAARSGEAVIFDPAAYCGDREADIAMTELFGGFPATFHAAYRASWPLDRGYEVRRDLYNLYHVLNHLNLFGGGYLRQAQEMISGLLAHIG